MANFPEFGNNYCFADFEAKVLDHWQKNKVFQRLLADKDNREAYGFYDGPPFATGHPHYGHLLAGTIKDIVPRYWSMRGYHVERRFGWDCHGLPVEYEMEKNLKLNGSLEIIDYGIAKFNEACRGIVLRYTSEWRRTVERMGRWVDLDNDYKTMDPDFMESIWWVFAELWQKGLVYQGKKVVPYSWRITAPLSNFEAGQNYKSVQDPAITVALPFEDDPTEGMLAWTTTPWTLPSNLALTVNEEMDYVKVAVKDEAFSVKHAWLAKSSLENFEKELSQDILETVKGKAFLGKHYLPLFDFFADERKKGAFRVIAGEFVSEGDGTGIVHTAPAFGEDDFFVCQKNNIELVDPTNDQAEFTAAAKPYEGKFVKDADKDIVKDLKAAGRLLKQATIQHNYPFCYRSDTPLIYKAISSWFVRVEDIKDKMQAHNQGIRWVPGHLRDGRFGNWLANARDWCVSRNRFWGTPIPVWICSECEHKEVIGNRETLDKRAGKHIKDLHMHFIDDVVYDCPECSGKNSMKRTPEVLDCWFESGSMPYAQKHYPFENSGDFNASFPADFIAEGLDQTRGWFYTLTVLATALFDKPAFKNCVVNGMVMAADGKKMSKSLKNYPDPNEILDKYGADSIRLYFMQSPAVHGEELRFDEKFLVENMRGVLLPLWNAYGFFASYANIDGFTKDMVDQADAIEKRDKIDRWILARMQETETAVHEAMREYELVKVAPHISRFTDDLTNWYIRLNRERFWVSNENGKIPADKLNAYATLWQVLDRMASVMAPFMPFFAEYLYAAIHEGVHPDEIAKKNPRSVHERLYSETQSEIAEKDKLIAEMKIAQTAILLGRSLRNDAKIGLRQPLSKISFAGLSETDKTNLLAVERLIKRELNVHEIEILADGTNLVEESVRPNLPKLGPRAGKNVGAIRKALGEWGSKEIQEFESKGSVEIAGVTITAEDLLIDRKAKGGKCASALNGLVAELHTELNENLVREGLQREIINRIQQRRKSDDLQLSDRIAIEFCGEGTCVEILKEEMQKQGLVSQEVLSEDWQNKDHGSLKNQEKYDFKQFNGGDTWFSFDIKKR